MKCLGHEAKILEGLPTTGSGTSTVDGPVIDMANYEAVTLVAKFGTGNNGNTVQAQQGALSSGSDAADLEGSQVTVNNAEGIVSLTIVKPQKRYITFQGLRGVATTIDWGTAFLYGGKTKPVNNNDGSSIVHQQVVSPNEGTP